MWRFKYLTRYREFKLKFGRQIYVLISVILYC